MKKKFGEILLERKLITPQQLADALELQRRRGLRLGAALVARGHLSEHQLVQALGSALNIKVVELAEIRIAPAAIQLVQHRFCLDHELIPYALRKERGRRVLSVAMSDPLNYRVIDELSFVTDSAIEPALARASDIDVAITRYYGRQGGSQAFGRDQDGTNLLGPPEHMDAADPNMAILRRGGIEEMVDTTGKLVSPFMRGPNGELLDNPEAEVTTRDRRTALGRDQSALLLTEEVPDSTPLEAGRLPAFRTPPPNPTTQPPISSRRAVPIPNQPTPVGPVPTAPGTVNTAIPSPVSFDDALGALIDAQGGAVNAEVFRELERKFWALMRVLAKKGILTNEDFIRELSDHD